MVSTNCEGIFLAARHCMTLLLWRNRHPHSSVCIHIYAFHEYTSCVMQSCIYVWYAVQQGLILHCCLHVFMALLNSTLLALLLHHLFHPDPPFLSLPLPSPSSSLSLPALWPLGAAWGDACGFAQWCLHSVYRRTASALERLLHSHRLWCCHAGHKCLLAERPTRRLDAAGINISCSSNCDTWGKMQHSNEPITGAACGGEILLVCVRPSE